MNRILHKLFSLFHKEASPEPALPPLRNFVIGYGSSWYPVATDEWVRCGYRPETASAMYIVGRKLANELNAKPGDPRPVHKLQPGVSGQSGPYGVSGATGQNIRREDFDL